MDNPTFTISKRWAYLYYYRRMLGIAHRNEQKKAWNAITDDSEYFYFTFSFFPNKGPWTSEENIALGNDWFGDICAFHPMYQKELGSIQEWLIRNYMTIFDDVQRWMVKMQ